MKEQLFRLNYLYIIDSLPETLQTGEILYKALYDNLGQGKYDGIKDIERKSVDNLQEWEKTLDEIREQILHHHVLPFIHVEMHSDGVSGLLLINGEKISWESLFKQLQDLNYCTHNYLFITLGVCCGLNIAFYFKIYDRSPFLGAVGSFKPLMNVDLLKQFAEFYDEILSSADVEKALVRLKKVPTQLDSDYRYIDTIGLFRRVYMDYLRKKCSKEGIQNRIAETFPWFLRKNHIVFPTRGIRRYFRKCFIKLLKKTKNREYVRAYKMFMMVDAFPENEDRFKMPGNVYDFKHNRTEFIEEA